MSRPKGDSDQRLIRAAQELLDEKGFTGLKVRNVAKKAGVNLGMFHYHFKTKENFQKRVMRDLYERFFADFRLETSQSGTPLERLRRALVTLSRFARDNRKLLLGVIGDAAQGDVHVMDFIQANFPRHALILFSLLKECQKKGYVERMPTHLAVSLLFPSIMAPNIAMAIVEHKRIPPLVRAAVRGIKEDILSNSILEKRVNYALRAVGADFTKRSQP